MGRKAIRYYCYIGNNGLCVAAKDYVVALYLQGVDVDVRPLNEHGPLVNESPIDRIFNFCYARDIEYDTVVAHSLCTRYKEIREVEGPKMRIIGLAVWETTKLSTPYTQSLQYVDEFVVPCKWNKDVFQQYTSKRISVVHHVIKSPDVPAMKYKDGHYMFYFIGEWCERKSIESLIELFNKAFRKDDKVHLYIKTFMFERVMSRDNFRKFISRYQSDRVTINIDNVSDTFIMSLHKRGDCYISLAKGEGVGIPICQASSYNKPVICLDFGGQLDYIKDGYLIKHKLINCNPCSPYHDKKCSSGRCYYYDCYTDNSQQWATYDKEQDVINAMVNAYNGKLKCSNKPFCEENFSYTKIGSLFNKVL